MEPKAEMGSVYPAGNTANGSLTGPRAGATVVRMVLGAQLRRLREAAGLTPEQAGYEIRASRSKMSRLEHGRVGFKIRDVEDLLTLYGVTDQKVRLALLALAEKANEQGWWTQYGDILADWFETYLGLEAAASLIRTVELQFVQACSRPGTTPGRSPCSGTGPPRRRTSTAGSACGWPARTCSPARSRPGCGRSWTRPRCAGRSAAAT
jgi:transcriptional regulator with XRE-family HTH domain